MVTDSPRERKIFSESENNTHRKLTCYVLVNKTQDVILKLERNYIGIGSLSQLNRNERQLNMLFYTELPKHIRTKEYKEI